MTLQPLTNLSAAAILALSGCLSSPAAADDPKAPETFQVEFETTKGSFTIEVTRKWSPVGADHFHALVKKRFYNDCGFFRNVDGFMVQFGINGDPEVQTKNRGTIKDDPVVASNQRGMITYAKTGAPNSRSTQLFINFGNNSFLDGQGFSPFGRVIKGMDVVDSLNNEYGERPNQGQIQTRGNEYLKSAFPRLDYIKSAKIVGDEESSADKK